MTSVLLDTFIMLLGLPRPCLASDDGSTRVLSLGMTADALDKKLRKIGQRGDEE